MKRYLPLIPILCLLAAIAGHVTGTTPEERAVRRGDVLKEIPGTPAEREEYTQRLLERNKSAAEAEPVQLAQGKADPVRWDDTKPNVPAGRRELTLRQRREMGLTIANLVSAAKELKASGEIDAQTSDAEITAAIAMHLETKSPQAFASASAADWDAILDFIGRVLPLILKLIALF